MATVYKIHPAIGVARLGNSAEYYLAPETPGGLPLDPTSGQPIYRGPGAPPQSIFHDRSGAVKKQAARFRVYAYDDTDPSDPGTRVQVGTTRVAGKTVTGIEWTVYLANKKAAWFEFRQLTGSGQEGDAGYLKNNANNPGGDKNRPFNPLRVNAKLGAKADPSTINDPVRRELILDPGPRTVTGPNGKPADFSVPSKGLQPFDITTLGRILTDGDANLIVLGGEGHSGTTDLPAQADDYANNSGWFDDASDGPVTGALVLEDGSKVAIDVPSWVMCGPPKFAPEIVNVVSMYDTMYDLFVRAFGLNPALFRNGQFQPDFQPNHAADIAPLLARPNLYQYVTIMPGAGRNNHARLPTFTSAQFNSRVKRILRSPNDINTPDLMPFLAGDNPLSPFQTSNYLSLTATQYFMLTQFAAGKVSEAAPPASGEGVALDRASLQNVVGGAFCPGIEMTWICRNTTIYRPLPAKPAMSDVFRIRHKPLAAGLTLTNGADNDYSGGVEPGDIIKYMAQPWQADFNECSIQPIDGTDYWWWPAQRPYSVSPAANPAQQLPWTRLTANDANPDHVFDNLQMVSCWKDVGFILNIAPGANAQFVEIERDQEAISRATPTV